MSLTYSFKKLLLELSNFEDLPEQWLNNRDKLVPYVVKAHQFAVEVARACYRDHARVKTCDFKEYADCHLSALVLRKTELSALPPGFTFDPVPCVSVTCEPANALTTFGNEGSEGEAQSFAFAKAQSAEPHFTYDYEPRIGLFTIRFFLTEDTYIKVQGTGDLEWGWPKLKSFSLVNKVSKDEKVYYPILVSPSSELGEKRG